MMSFPVATRSRSQLVDVTELVRKAVRESGILEGLCCVSTPHTTAGVVVNENSDPDVARDLLGHLERLVPRDGGFRHSEGNSDAHIKAVLAGPSKVLPIHAGEPVLGVWQGVYLAEFDGPRSRTLTVSCVPGA